MTPVSVLESMKHNRRLYVCETEDGMGGAPYTWSARRMEDLLEWRGKHHKGRLYAKTSIVLWERPLGKDDWEEVARFQL